VGVHKKAKKLGCCERFREKRKSPCKHCPLMDTLSKQERRKLLARHA